MTTPPPFAHQLETAEFARQHPYFYDASDPGTGKTRSSLIVFAEERAAGAGPALVFAPKSILRAAWGADIDKFFPGMKYSIANAQNRAQAFALDADVYITNLDAVVWVAKNMKPKNLQRFSRVIVDEATAYKHATSQRSKAAKYVCEHIDKRELMSGTPFSNTITELWHQYLLVDRGERLGKSFWKFRNTVQEPRQVGPRPEMVEWTDKPGIEAAVLDLLSDITIRHKFEDCVSIPPNHQRTMLVDLPRALRTQYEDMKRDALLLTQQGTIQALHAASVHQKLLQICSGAVYGQNGTYIVLDDQRVQMTMDLVEERPHSLVAFLWKHQRDGLIAEAKKRGIKYAVIDGDTDDRYEISQAFQSGQLKVIFAHPQSAGHGLTLTRGVATIWPSPTYNPEHYRQFFHRIYRTGQDKETETIHIIARNTIEEIAHGRREEKLTSMDLFLSLAEAA